MIRTWPAFHLGMRRGRFCIICMLVAEVLARVCSLQVAATWTPSLAPSSSRLLLSLVSSSPFSFVSVRRHGHLDDLRVFSSSSMDLFADDGHHFRLGHPGRARPKLPTWPGLRWPHEGQQRQRQRRLERQSSHEFEWGGKQRARLSEDARRRSPSQNRVSRVFRREQARARRGKAQPRRGCC